MLKIDHVTEKGEPLEIIIELFKAYAIELDEDICFQNFEKELANPLYKYGPPYGSILLAYWDNEPVGCVALQRLLNEQGLTVCEMKRLYVKPEYRKHNIGNTLADLIIEEAVKLGYDKMKLDSLDKLRPAINMYEKKGFITTNAYYNNPLKGVVFMEKQLKASATNTSTH
jgi:GNAT superfamily N-acetyltransferase